jgi:hypothetical protein
MVIDAPFDQVWGYTVAYVAQRGWPIAAVEKESGLITTQQAIFAQNEHDVKECARTHGALSYWGEGRFSLNIYLRKVSDTQTSASVTAHIEGFDQVWSKSWQPLESKGVIEQQVLDQIKFESAIHAKPAVAPAIAADSSALK